MATKKSPIEAVKQNREKQEATREKIIETEMARVSKQDALANAEALLNRRMAVAENVLTLHHLSQPGYAPTNDCGLEKLDAFTLQVFCNEKGVREFLKREIEEVYATGDVVAMTDTERQTCLHGLKKDLHKLEVEEEEIIEQAEADGITIDRRDDLDPRIVLGLAPDEKPAWDFQSDKLDRIVGEADAAHSLYTIRSDAWVELRDLVAQEKQRLREKEERGEPAAGLRAQEHTVKFTEDQLNRAAAARQEASDRHTAKRGPAQALTDFLETNRQNRPVAYSMEDMRANYTPPPAPAPSGHEFGKTRSERID